MKIPLLLLLFACSVNAASLQQRTDDDADVVTQFENKIHVVKTPFKFDTIEEYLLGEETQLIFGCDFDFPRACPQSKHEPNRCCKASCDSSSKECREVNIPQGQMEWSLLMFVIVMCIWAVGFCLCSSPMVYLYATCCRRV